MEDRKTKKISALMIITIAIFMLTLGGATYAYLRNQNYGKETESNVETLTYTTDSLSFNTSGDISIRANTENFEENMGNLTATAVATATLLANNKTNVATMNYGVYMNINENDYEYSTTEKYPELLLQVLDPNGNEVTSVNGLEYVTYKEGTEQEVSGFDVTTKKGVFILAYNYAIAVDKANTDHLTNQEWKVKVTLVNLDTDQEVNARKVFDTDVHIDKGTPFADYLKRVVYENDSTLLLHNSSLANGAADNSYRYAGASANVKNYVCFGSDKVTCPTNNLYRIIGVFGNQVKLIKNTSIGTMKWASGDNNTYSSSLLRSTVNGSYLSGLGTKWQSMISTHNWKVGGMSYANGRSSTAKTAYNYEVGPNSSNTTSKDKVGLMYVSDYYYAASTNYWTTKGENYNNAKGSNWMYLGADEWTISRAIDHSTRAFNVSRSGDMSYYNVPSVSYAVRPSIYLTSSTLLVSGSGSTTDPYRISAV